MFITPLDMHVVIAIVYILATNYTNYTTFIRVIFRAA
jgi:hypothetical protein